MSYREMTNILMNTFNQYNFLELTRQRDFNSQSTLLNTLPNGSQIYVTFPGYKSKISNGRITAFDYRVNIRTNQVNTALSHVNIIIDLYNKFAQLGQNRGILATLLYDLAANGDDFNRGNYALLDQYIFAPPNANLINYTHQAHAALNKTYNASGNTWSYTLDELTSSILWIVLQEDINYPMPRYQGRRMPFYRYLEALYCANNPDDPVHTLDLLIERATSHIRPPLWVNCGINYAPVQNLR